MKEGEFAYTVKAGKADGGRLASLAATAALSPLLAQPACHGSGIRLEHSRHLRRVAFAAFEKSGDMA